MQWRTMKRVTRTFAILLLLTGSLLFAEQVTVQQRHIDILKGKGSMYLPPLATANPGDSLQVLAHEGRWCRVQYGSIVGYALQGALDGTSDSASYAPSGGGSTDATASTAAKGWDSTTWAQSRGYSQAGLQRLNEIRDRISEHPGLWESFKATGHVGAH